MPYRCGNSHAIWDSTVLPSTQQSDIPTFTQPINAGTQISDPGRMQGLVDVVLYKYPVQKWNCDL